MRRDEVEVVVASDVDQDSGEKEGEDESDGSSSSDEVSRSTPTKRVRMDLNESESECGASGEGTPEGTGVEQCMYTVKASSVMPEVMVEVENKFAGSDNIKKVEEWIKGVVYVIGGNTLVNDMIHIDNAGMGCEAMTIGEAMYNEVVTKVDGVWRATCVWRSKARAGTEQSGSAKQTNMAGAMAEHNGVTKNKKTHEDCGKSSSDGSKENPIDLVSDEDTGDMCEDKYNTKKGGTNGNNEGGAYTGHINNIPSEGYNEEVYTIKNNNGGTNEGKEAANKKTRHRYKRGQKPPPPPPQTCACTCACACACVACTDTCAFEHTGDEEATTRQSDARQVSDNSSNKSRTVVDELNNNEMDAELTNYENEMIWEEAEMQWGLGDDPEGVEPCVEGHMDRPAPGQNPQPTEDDDDCMQDIKYNDNTVNRMEESDAEADDAMEDTQDDDYVAACRGQKRRLHTICEISSAARSKMIKQLEPGIT